MFATLTRGCMFALPIFALSVLFALVPGANANVNEGSYWKVDDLRAGMKGYGKTVMKGTKIEAFDVLVLGILKNTSPGRDMVLARLAGLDLEKTGVIQGMSGSPVYIEGKLVGAVAYAWQFGKEPIAGITPFSQMHGYVEAYEKRDLADQQKPNRIGLAAPLTIGDQAFDAVTISNDFDDPRPTAADGLLMVPLSTPLSATGFTDHSLKLMRNQLKSTGLMPVQGGAVSAKVAKEARDTIIEPGAALTVGLVMGDFDVSGLGTVTHVEGKRVYGWGHPLYGSGACELPLMTGYVHTVFPRQSISFKIGSPIKSVGVINADVSTCIAGWLDRQASLVPVKMTLTREDGSNAKTFNVQIVRQPKLLASMVLNCLTNSVDMEGELPEDLTAEMQVQFELEGYPPVVLNDTFAGSSYSGGRAPQALYQPVSNVIQMLTYNNWRQVPIKSISCTTKISNGRKSADIEAVELENDTLRPGETLKATVYLRAYKGQQQRVQVTLKLPLDLPEGSYTATISDDLICAKQELRDDPMLSTPQTIDQAMKAIKVQTAVKRTNLAIRVPTGAAGVAVNGKALPNLPAGMVEIMGSGKRTGSQTIGAALTARQETEWVVSGSETVRFTVAKTKRGLPGS